MQENSTKDLDAHIQWMISQQETEGQNKPTETPSARSLRCDECNKLFRNADDANLHAERSGHEAFRESSDEVKQLTPEEKAEQLKLLQEKLKKKREERANQELADQAKNIKMHRESQRKMTELARLNEEKDMQKLVEQRKREKQEEILQKQRVLAQIEADKLERKLRNAPIATTTQPPSAQEPAAVAKRPTGDTSNLRIKFRDGTVLTEAFQANDKLSRVIEFIEKSKGVSKFKLIVTYPREELKDKGKTLLELGLVPSANLMIE